MYANVQCAMQQQKLAKVAVASHMAFINDQSCINIILNYTHSQDVARLRPKHTRKIPTISLHTATASYISFRLSDMHCDTKPYIV